MPSISSYNLNTDEKTEKNSPGDEILFGLFCGDVKLPHS